jgi:hypothetical protein
MGIEICQSAEDTTIETFLDSPEKLIIINSRIGVVFIHLKKYEERRVKAGFSSFFLCHCQRSWGADMEKVCVARALEAALIALRDRTFDLPLMYPSIDILSIHLKQNGQGCAELQLPDARRGSPWDKVHKGWIKCAFKA